MAQTAISSILPEDLGRTATVTFTSTPRAGEASITGVLTELTFTSTSMAMQIAVGSLVLHVDMPDPTVTGIAIDGEVRFPRLVTQAEQV